MVLLNTAMNNVPLLIEEINRARAEQKFGTFHHFVNELLDLVRDIFLKQSGKYSLPIDDQIIAAFQSAATCLQENATHVQDEKRRHTLRTYAHSIEEKAILVECRRKKNCPASVPEIIKKLLTRINTPSIQNYGGDPFSTIQTLFRFTSAVIGTQISAHTKNPEMLAAIRDTAPFVIGCMTTCTFFPALSQEEKKQCAQFADTLGTQWKTLHAKKWREDMPPPSPIQQFLALMRWLGRAAA